MQALPPEREETSSPNVIGAIALHAAMDMLGYIGWPAITGYERRIALSLQDTIEDDDHFARRADGST